MQIVATFAEFERAMLRERTRKGLEQARSHGRIGGRRPKLKPHQQDEIICSVQSGKKTAADAARLFNIDEFVKSSKQRHSRAGGSQ